MRWHVLGMALALGSAGSTASARPPLHNPAMLNIGFVCQWQEKCMDRQQGAMDRALKFVKKYKPATWRVQQCNRNASRRYARVDWIGFNNCIRNETIRPQPVRRPPPRTARRR